jgi:hypothetical protein
VKLRRERFHEFRKFHSETFKILRRAELSKHYPPPIIPPIKKIKGSPHYVWNPSHGKGVLTNGAAISLRSATNQSFHEDQIVGNHSDLLISLLLSGRLHRDKVGAYPSEPRHVVRRIIERSDTQQ